MANSEARRQQRRSAVKHKLASAMQAAAQLDAEQNEREKQKAHEWQARNRDHSTRSESEGDTSDDDTSDEDSSSDEHDKGTPTQLSSVAGVPRDRREAQQRKLVPLKALINLVKEARTPSRQQRTTSARMLTRLVQNHNAMQQVRQQTMQIRARRRKARRLHLQNAGVKATLCMVRRWQIKCWHSKRRNIAATVRQFHSLLIQIEVRTAHGCQSVVVIADTGTGPNIFRMMDVDTAAAEFGMAPAQPGLVTADSSTLAGLCGRTTVQMRFSKTRKVHALTA